jgi:hypothetical protein
MTTCPYCAEDISPNDSVCPYCDAKINEPPPRRRHVQKRAEDDLGMRMLLPVGRSGWAIAAGYLGLFSLLCFPAPFALIVGLIAVYDINKHSEKHGMGRAVFGIVMGALGCIFMVLAVISSLAG